MSRLIDADALRDLIYGGYDLDFNDTPETKKELLRMIDEARDWFEALAKMSSANKVDIDICFDHDGDIRVTISPSWSWRLGIDEESENAD